MSQRIDGCVEDILLQQGAIAGDVFADDFGNEWVVQDDRNGLRLQIKDKPDAWLPFWTAMTIKLPGLHRVIEEDLESQKTATLQ
ncbi:Uncharacterised protein [BD1-7 clade bacterium]|uniref:Uncharacterized protein n=1 Tax=BD1-7 clade bacterium TaxID=2029982 RepID=A0A5S9P9E7_9GAMM|nr:Uncharacterised protein [BD1-7 clade bacterium]